jgi:hypothetical protein
MNALHRICEHHSGLYEIYSLQGQEVWAVKSQETELSVDKLQSVNEGVLHRYLTHTSTSYSGAARLSLVFLSTS